MRIVVVTPTVARLDNGLEVYSVRLAEALAEVGAEVVVCTVDADRVVPASPVSTPGGVGIRRHRGLRRLGSAAHRLGRRLPRGRARALFERVGSPALSWELARDPVVRRADVVIAVGAFPLVSLQCLALHRLGLGPPVLLVGLLHLGCDRRIGTQHRFALRRSAGYLALTDVEADAARAVLGPTAVLAAIPPPVPAAGGRPAERHGPAPKPDGRGGHPVVIGYVGRLTRAKDVDVLVEAFARSRSARERRAELVLAGSSTSDTPSLRAGAMRAADSGVAVRMVEDFAPADAPALYDSFDVVVNPSRHESFGMVFAEAWARGLPVVGAHVPAVADVIRDGRDGLLCAPGDRDALAEAMDALVADAELRRRLGECGRERVEATLAPTVVGARVLELVRRMGIG